MGAKCVSFEQCRRGVDEVNMRQHTYCRTNQPLYSNTSVGEVDDIDIDMDKEDDNETVISHHGIHHDEQVLSEISESSKTESNSHSLSMESPLYTPEPFRESQHTLNGEPLSPLVLQYQFSPEPTNVMPLQYQMSPEPVVPPQYQFSPEPVMDSIIEPIMEPMAMMDMNRQISREMIKQQVTALYDVEILPTPKSVHSDYPIHSRSRSDHNLEDGLLPQTKSPSNLISEQTNQHWKADDIMRLSVEMSAELEHLHQSFSAFSPNEVVSVGNGSSTAKTANAMSVTPKMESILSVGNRARSHSHSHSFSRSASETEVHSESMEMDDDDGNGGNDGNQEVSKSAVFRAETAYKWSARDIEATKSAMANQMVHLQTNMLVTEQKE